MKNVELKRKYIQAASEIIHAEGRQAVSIRRLGKELNCNTASLYRCFQDLDELFLYTGLKYVEDYLHDLRHLMDEPLDNLQLFLAVWKCFISHSFINPKMYNSLFFGKYSQKLESAVEEYFSRLFPEELVQFDEETRETLMKGSFATGDATMSKILIKCAEEEWIAESDRLYIDKLFLQIYKGYLKDFVDGRVLPSNHKQTEAELNAFLSEIITKYQLKES